MPTGTTAYRSQVRILLVPEFLDGSFKCRTFPHELLGLLLLMACQFMVPSRISSQFIFSSAKRALAIRIALRHSPSWIGIVIMHRFGSIYRSSFLFFLNGFVAFVSLMDYASMAVAFHLLRRNTYHKCSTEKFRGRHVVRPVHTGTTW